MRHKFFVPTIGVEPDAGMNTVTAMKEQAEVHTQNRATQAATHLA